MLYQSQVRPGTCPPLFFCSQPVPSVGALMLAALGLCPSLQALAWRGFTGQHSTALPMLLTALQQAACCCDVSCHCTSGHGQCLL